jgi:hypothetical protein
MKKQILLSLCLLAAVNAPVFGMFRAAKSRMALAAVNVASELRALNPITRAELRGEQRVWREFEERKNVLEKERNEAYDKYDASFDKRKISAVKLRLVVAALEHKAPRESMVDNPALLATKSEHEANVRSCEILDSAYLAARDKCDDFNAMYKQWQQNVERKKQLDANASFVGKTLQKMLSWFIS